MKLPISNQLKKRKQLEVAVLQDELMQIIYSISDDIIVHGGTAIWRCYGGKRFSEDIDVYSKSLPEARDRLERAVASHGLTLDKYKDTGNVVFSSISDGRTSIQLETNHSKTIAGRQVLYELVDGTFLDILSLAPEQLILEKALAYSDRRFVRDLYDIYILSHSVSDLNVVRNTLRVFLDNIVKPVDEPVLKSLIYAGLTPTFNRMVDEIRKVIR